MHFLGQQGKNAQIHHQYRRHQGKPRQDQINNDNGKAMNQEKHTKAYRKDSSTQQVHIKISRAQPAIFQSP
jgi:hypothetical protein